MEGEWITAARAHWMVASTLSSGAHRAICSRAFDGLIRARAKRVIAGKHTVDDCPVPQAFWWARGHATLTQNWATGDFSTWIDHAQWRVYGVEFAREDIESMLPPTIEPEPSKPIGGRRQSDLWRPWVAELVAYIHENGIPDGVGAQGQEELIKGIADALAERSIEALGRSTVQPVIQEVLDRLRAAEK
jgi:hypothetical protein